AKSFQISRSRKIWYDFASCVCNSSKSDAAGSARATDPRASMTRLAVATNRTCEFFIFQKSRSRRSRKHETLCLNRGRSTSLSLGAVVQHAIACRSIVHAESQVPLHLSGAPGDRRK